MMPADFSLADELHFLAIQCTAQADSNQRHEDRAFIHRLVAVLWSITGCQVRGFVAQLIADAAVEGACLACIIRQAGVDLEHCAALITNAGRAA